MNKVQSLEIDDREDLHLIRALKNSSDRLSNEQNFFYCRNRNKSQW